MSKWKGRSFRLICREGLMHRTPTWTVKDVQVERVRSRWICREGLIHRTPNWTVKDARV